VTRRSKVVLGLAAVWLLGMMGVMSIVVPSNWTDRNVPSHLRADRWELTPDGQIARSRTESECGEMPYGVWIDAPPGAARPVLLGATDEMVACFDDRVAPAFPINGF